MPNVIAIPRSQQNGQLTTDFISVVGNTATTYTYPTEQAALKIMNRSSVLALTVTVNGTNYTVPPDKYVVIAAAFTSFTIIALAPSQPFYASATTAPVSIFGSGVSVGAPKKQRTFVTNRNSAYTLNTSDGSASNQNVTYRIVYTVEKDTYDPQIIFGNAGTDDRIAGLNDLPIKAGIQFIDFQTLAAVRWPVYFGGKRLYTIEPGGYVISDVLPFMLKKGQQLVVYVNLNVPLGQKWPENLWMNAANQDGKAQGDLVDAGHATYTSEYGYGPFMIVGKQKTLTPSIVLSGTSIIRGSNDTGIMVEGGFAVRALQGKFPICNISRGGEAFSQFAGSQYHKFRMLAADFGTHVLMDGSTNDFFNGRTLAQTKADAQIVWDEFAARDLKIFMTTTLPRTVSQADMSPISAPFALGDAKDQWNDFVMSLPAPLTGVFDTAATVASPSDKSKWAVSTDTSDGTHPSTAGHIKKAAAIDTTRFVV